jgi:tetratricopeptide (TPR) repeat protein
LLEIRDYFFGHLRQDVDLSWWEFEHQQFRVCRLAAIGEEERTRLHHLLVDCLDEFPEDDAYKQTEYLYHCQNADLYPQAIRFLASLTPASALLSSVFLDMVEYDDRQGRDFLISAAAHAVNAEPAGSTEPAVTAKEKTDFFANVLPLIGVQYNIPSVSYPYLKHVSPRLCELTAAFRFAEASDKKARLLYPISFLLKGRQANMENDRDGAIEAYEKGGQLIERFVPVGLTEMELEIYLELLFNIGDAYSDKEESYLAKSYFDKAIDILDAMDEITPGEHRSDRIRTETFLARLTEDAAESRAHYQKALDACNAMLDEGTASVTDVKLVILQEMAEIPGSAPEEAAAICEEALTLSRREYEQQPDRLPVVLAYAGCLHTAAKLSGSKAFAEEALALLRRLAEDVPDRPKVRESRSRSARPSRIC